MKLLNNIRDEIESSIKDSIEVELDELLSSLEDLQKKEDRLFGKKTRALMEKHYEEMAKDPTAFLPIAEEWDAHQEKIAVWRGPKESKIRKIFLDSLIKSILSK